jgi:hypothetical protein
MKPVPLMHWSCSRAQEKPPRADKDTLNLGTNSFCIITLPARFAFLGWVIDSMHLRLSIEPARRLRLSAYACCDWYLLACHAC